MICKRGKRIQYLVICLFSVLFCMLFCEKKTYAAPAVNIQKRIMDKAIYQGVYKCYTTDGMLKSSLNLSDYHDMGSLMGENAGHANFVNLVSGGHDGLMGRMIDSGSLRYNEGDDSLSCRQLFVGREDSQGGNHGILEATGNSAPSNNSTNEVVRFFENMGYVVTGGAGGGTCYSVVFKKGYGDNYVSVRSSNKICQGQDGSLYAEPVINSLATSGGFVAFGVQGGKVCLRFRGTDGEQLRCGELVDYTGRATDSLNRNTLGITIEEKICNDRSGTCIIGDSSTNGAEAYRYDDAIGGNGTAEQDSLANRTASFPSQQDGGSAAAAHHAIDFLSGGQVGEELGLSRPEKRILYQEYLTDYYEYEIDCENEHANSRTIWWFDSASGQVKECYITREGNSPERKVHAVNDDGMFEGEINASDIEGFLNEERDNYSDEELAELGGVASGDREYEEVSDCRSSGAGKNLGYILCTILELAGKTVTGVYEEHIGPMLSAKTEFFTDSSVSGQQVPYQAWQQFRDIANMIFVALLLVVIFSQLTGVGIDNYGIKRILPKLIVSVVLINMSYLICMIAIDVSNIIGNGVQALFENLGNGLEHSIDVEGNNVGSTGGLVTFGLVGGLATMVGVVWASPLILLSLLPSVLGALVAVFFLFFLISARQAAIVVLVVLSPLAMACSVLPNTKSIFSQYLKMFEAMLLVYPITSLLVSGGDYVSKLILQIGGGNSFSLALTAMVVGIIPIFFIPSMIKNSFAALGKIGGAVAGFGKTLGGVTGKAVQSSDLFKNSQAAAAERSARIKGGFDRNGNPVRGHRRTIANILSGGAAGRQRNALQYQQMVAKRGSLAAADERDFMLKTDTENELKRIIASGEINDIGNESGGMQRRLTEALQSNDSGSRARIRAYTDALSSQGEAGRGAVKAAYNAAVQTGNVSDENAHAFASNIIANHSVDYKNNNRSMFEVARGINNDLNLDPNDRTNNFRVARAADGNFITTEQFTGTNSGRVGLMANAKAETLATMDDAAFAEAFLGTDPVTGEVLQYEDQNHQANVGQVNLNGLSDAQKLAVGKNAYNALQNSANMNANRVAMLKAVLDQSEYRPDIQRVEIINRRGGNAGAGGGTP